MRKTNGVWAGGKIQKQTKNRVKLKRKQRDRVKHTEKERLRDEDTSEKAKQQLGDRLGLLILCCVCMNRAADNFGRAQDKVI